MQTAGLFSTVQSIARSDLRGPEKGVLHALVSLCDRGGVTWAAVRTIAARAGVCRRTVQVVLRRLAELGWITLDRARGRTNTVRIFLQRYQTTKGNPPKRGSARRAPNQRDHPCISEVCTPPSYVGAEPESPVEGYGWRERLLAAAGIRGRWLQRLAESPITRERIVSECKSVSADTRVKNPAAVLVHRLSEWAGMPPSVPTIPPVAFREPAPTRASVLSRLGAWRQTNGG